MPFAEYLYGATVVILLLEIVCGRHRHIYDRHVWLVTVGCIIGNAISRPGATLLIAFVVAALFPSGQGALAGTPFWLAFTVTFVVTEFAFYWSHRLAHQAIKWKNPWLWKLHRTHHSAKFLNVGVTIRVNTFWPFVVSTPWVLGLATYLGLGAAAGATIVVIYGWNLITHSHFRWDDAVRSHPRYGKMFRALEHIVASPGIHHTHHGYGKDGGSFRNYAVTLSCFDWMFGTLHIPSGRPWRYGVPGQNAHWAEEAFYPLIRAKRAPR